MTFDLPTLLTCFLPSHLTHGVPSPPSQALVRMGLLTANLDSPMHSKWSGTKCSNAKTHKFCSMCTCTRKDIANDKFPVQKKGRTDDQLKADLAYVLAGDTADERKRRSRSRGVTVPALPSPLGGLVFSRIRGIGVDILHQDAIVSYD